MSQFNLIDHPSRTTIDLRSDTVTRPDRAMREAIASAEVGDDVLGDDPTVAELERFVANLLGKEQALFFPSGLMANQTAILIQATAGSEVVVDEGAHILNYEDGAAAAWAGVQLRSVRSNDGVPDPAAIAAAIRPKSEFLPRTALICLENTHNSAGGRILPLEVMSAVAEIAQGNGVPVHLDGARLPNAAIASDRQMREWAAFADTVMISLSKGLGAPVGSLLAGSTALMQAARRVRRRLGGGMRQSGLLAAAGLHALTRNYQRLADDHRRATTLARGVDRIDGLSSAAPETNIVMIDIAARIGMAGEIVAALEGAGIRTTAFGPYRIRAVTHLDVDDAGIERAVATMAMVCGRRSAASRAP